MKIELIKYANDEFEPRWKLMIDDTFINVYLTEEEGIEGFDKLSARLQEPKQQPEIIKSITI